MPPSRCLKRVNPGRVACLSHRHGGSIAAKHGRGHHPRLENPARSLLGDSTPWDRPAAQPYLPPPPTTVAQSFTSPVTDRLGPSKPPKASHRRGRTAAVTMPPTAERA